MKTSNYLWAALATTTLSLSACSSDENENGMQPKEKTAKLELTLVGAPADSRATGTLPTTDESQINRLTVAVFTGATGNPVNALREFTGKDIKDAETGSGKTISILCEPGDEQTIYVVANASPALFAGVTNLAGFKAKLMLLSETTKAAGSGDATDVQKPSNLPMLGIVNKQNLTAGTETTATAALTRLVARTSISSIKIAFDKAGQFKDATFNVTGIYLKNANSSVNAEKTGSVPISGSDKANKYLYEAVSSHTANTELTTSAPVTRYYPVTINKKQANTTITGGEGTDKGSIAANTRYVLTALIKGEGVDDDSKEIDPATLKLTVTVADWALTINQNVTFE